MTQESALKQQAQERRKARRHVHRGYGTIFSPDGSWPIHILNLSRSGALVALLEPHTLKNGDQITLHVDPGQGGAIIMHGTIAHQKAHYLGIRCEPNSTEDIERLETLTYRLTKAKDSAFSE